MKLYDVDGKLRRLSDEHAEILGVTPVDEASESSSGVPKQSSSKQTWVDYAISQGADPELAQQSTKSALVEQYG